MAVKQLYQAKYPLITLSLIIVPLVAIAAFGSQMLQPKQQGSVQARPQACLRAAQTAVPKKSFGRTLRIGVPAIIPNTMPALSPWPTTRLIAGAVHRGLVGKDEHGKLIPMLAEQVPTLENGGVRRVGDPTSGQERLVVTFRLRNGLRWSDGTPITSADAVFTHQFLRTEDTINQAEALAIDGVEAPESRTIVINYRPGIHPQHYSQPFSGVLYPAHALQGLTPAEVEAGLCALRPIGAGPYVVREWRYIGKPRNPPLPGVVVMSREDAKPRVQVITLEPNPYYFGGQSSIDRVVLEVILDQEVLLDRLRRGQLDMLADRSVEAISPAVEQALDEHFVLGQAFGQRWERLSFNTLQGPTADPLVRRAIAYAIDREAIAEDVFGGWARVMQSWIPQSSWAYTTALTHYRLDLNRARSLLREAGYHFDAEGYANRDGQRLRLVLYFSQDSETRRQIASRLQQSLSNIGIELTLQPVPRGAILGVDGILELRRFDLVMFGWQGDSEPEGYSLWHSSQIPSAENAWLGHNYAGWRNTENDRLLERLRTPADRAQRRDWYQRQQQLFAEALPVLPLFEYPRFVLSTPQLAGLKLPVGKTPITWNIEKWRWQVPKSER